jgi:endonuclease VIII
MPEGHTLYRLATDLTTAFAGGPVRASSPQGRFAADAALIDDSTLIRAESGGKHLFVEFAGDRFVHVHLGLIGTWLVRPGAAPEPVGAVRLRLENGRHYADLRGAIVCDLVSRERRDEVLAHIGPDPLRADADPDRAWRRIHGSDRAIGDLIMDQQVLAGVGNVYRAELLFRHRIDPLRSGRTMRRARWQAMWQDLVTLMAEGVRTGRIDTVRPEHLPEVMGRAPRRDDHGGEVYVYRRTGQPCHVCGTLIRTTELKGRNLFWCPRCQPRFRSRAKRSAGSG